MSTEVDIIQPSALEMTTQAEMNCQITTAKRFPRELKTVMRKAHELATYNEDIAGACSYRLERQGKTIEGASARLAEIAAGCWGNLRVKANIIDIGEREVTAQGIAHDLESNTAYCVEVKRRITAKSGKRFGDDMILMTCNAATSIAARNATLKVIPKSYIDELRSEAKKKALGDASTLADRRQKCVERFAQMGVKEEQLLAKLKIRNIEEVTTAGLQILVGLFTGIQEGVTTIDEEFGAVENTGKDPLVDPAKVKAWWTMMEKEKLAEYVADKDTQAIAAGVTESYLADVKNNAIKAQKEQIESEPDQPDQSAPMPDKSSDAGDSPFV